MEKGPRHQCTGAVGEQYYGYVDEEMGVDDFCRDDMLCTMLCFYWKSLKAKRKMEDAKQLEKQGDPVWSANWTRMFVHPP